MKRTPAVRRAVHEARAAAWVAGGTLVGGAGAMMTGTGDSPLRHILPDSINYFQHSGNMLWSGFLAAFSVILASKAERKRGIVLSAAKFAGAAALSGLLVGGAANTTYETHIGYETIGRHIPLAGGKTQDPWDLIWGTGYTVLLSAGMGGDLRRNDLKPVEAGNVPLPAGTPVPGGDELPLPSTELGRRPEN